MSYNNNYYKDNTQDKDRPALKFYTNVSRRLCAKGISLDYGCGCGYLLKRFSKIYTTTYGWDLSFYAREKSRLISPSSIIVDDLNELNNKKFDFIISLHVLEHVELPLNVLSWMYEHLSNNGICLIVVPNPKGLGLRLKKTGTWFGYRDKTHCSLLTPEQWKECFSNAKFSIIHEYSDGLWDFPYIPYIPDIIQKVILGIPTFIQTFITRGYLFIPANWGECSIFILCRK